MTTLFISHSTKDKAWAEALRQHLLDEGYTSLFLDSHPDDGISVGAKWEQTLWQHLRQSRGMVVLCTRHWLASPWCVAEAMIARERGKPVFLLASADIADERQIKGTENDSDSPCVPDFLKDTQFIRLAGITKEEAHQRLSRGLEAEGLNENFPLPRRPYPGLAAFQESDAAVFFGRSDDIERVREVLNRRRRNNAKGFIVLLGASGCGKSSLVRAGVLPRLKRDDRKLPTMESWVVLPPFAGGRGLEALCRTLAAAFDEAGQPVDLSWIRKRLAVALQPAGTETAARELRKFADELLVASKRTEGHVLLVLDQMEEVFGTAEASDARATLALLLAASADSDSSVLVLATMRSDYLGDFQRFPGVAEQYEGITLDPMPKSRFGELIEGPADRFGLTLEAGFTERLVEDTRYDDALPLLAFTLERLYRDQDALSALTLHDYEHVFPPIKVLGEGRTTLVYRGVSAAIKHVADKVLQDTGYIGLPDEDPIMRDLRRAFYCLAQVGDEGQFIRRTASWAQMPESSRGVLERLAKERLLTFAVENNESDSENKYRTINVTHEAIFRVWDTLHRWLLQDRKALALRNQIEDAADEWADLQQVESRRWPNERVLDATGQITRSGVTLKDVRHHDVVRAFLGPTDLDVLEALPAATEADNASCGSDRFGDAWRLPLSHEARARVGERLALLGDPRRGVGVRRDGLPDIAWQSVKRGTVTIQIRSEPYIPTSAVTRTVDNTVESFSIARYPVTIGQFGVFLNECFKDGEWRLPSGCPVDFPATYRPPRHRARMDNHPADNLTFLHASAFCHWLGVRLGLEIRLPTEFEWQLAATGGDSSHTYPWGPDWDPQLEPWRANTEVSDLGRSTAVGLYPAGQSPARVQDMAGTVWEWCINSFEEPLTTDTGPSEKDALVIRGGSWGNDPGFARSASRFRGYAESRSYFIGFRVLCSSPKSTP